MPPKPVIWYSLFFFFFLDYNSNYFCYKDTISYFSPIAGVPGRNSCDNWENAVV